MNEIVNDVVVIIGIFGKSLRYRGDSTQNFLSVILFTSLVLIPMEQCSSRYVVLLSASVFKTQK